MRGRVVLAMALVLALVPWGAEAALPVDPVSGDTVVTVDTTVQNETIAPGGNLSVQGFATLTLKDCRLVMKPGTEIRVISCLVMRNVSVSCSEPGPRYAFLCRGRLDMDNCSVSGSNTWQLNPSSYDCSITNSTFNMSGAGIGITNGTPLLRGNRFIAGDYTYYYIPMVSIRDSAPVLERNTFDGSSRRYDGLEIDYPASPLVSNNTFVNCSMALLFYYIHQHGDGGGISPPPGNAARLDDNVFQNCLYGIITSDSPMGHGQGRADIMPRAGPEPDAIFIADGNRFDNCTTGIYANGEAPSIIERCGFSGNQEAVHQSQSNSMHISSSAFTNNTVGVKTSWGDLALAGCTFVQNDRSLVCDNTASVIEGNTFNGGVNDSVSLYSYSDLSYYFANNTMSGPNAIGLRLEGTGVIINNTFKECPFGIYRAVRMYGQGHGRDIGQGPPAVEQMALIAQNRFENNQRGIYSEGWSNITENEFTGNRAGVEVSRFIHPVDTGDIYRDTGGQVDLLRVDQNTFTNNSDGVLFLSTNPYGKDEFKREIRENIFKNNTIGIDLLLSEADCAKNNFSQNSGWAFRQMESNSAYSKNEFGRCDRLWRQKLFDARVLEPPDDDLYAPHNEYQCSNNASVRFTDRAGTALYTGMTIDGFPPDFSVDGFGFPCLNITMEMVFGNDSLVRTSPVQFEAWKPGKGVASETVDLYSQLGETLYLEPTPDIVVRDLNFTSASAIAGESLTGSFTVLNDNTYDPANVSLQDVMVDVLLDGASFQTVRIPWLRSGVPEVRRIDWTANAGNHTWTVWADPQGLFRELRTDNNRASYHLDVNGRPEAIIEADLSEALSAVPFNFSGARSSDDGSVVAYLFDFGDGTVSDWSSNATAVHAYARAGLYDARLKVRDDRALESDWSAPWPVNIINRPPSLRLDLEKTDVLTMEPVNLTVTASDPEEGVLTVSWDFGDGGQRSGRDLFSVSHGYPDDGTYVLRVSVADSDGGVVTAAQNITVRNRPPTASFVVSPPEGTVLTRFSFMPVDRDQDGQVLSYLWDLGDGTASIMMRPAHNYDSPGTYNVSLTVKDDDGAVSDPFILAVTVVNSPPVARARSSNGAPRAGLALTFDASASFDVEDPLISISWDFGDGAVASGPVVRHAFKRPGNYTVRARVTDSFGAVSEAVIPVTVLDEQADRNDDAGWLMAATGGGILTIIGAVFLVWVLKNRPQSARRPRQRIVRRVRSAKNVDAYALRLARSRRSKLASENSNRSMYDEMQPVRDEGKDRETG